MPEPLGGSQFDLPPEYIIKHTEAEARCAFFRTLAVQRLNLGREPYRMEAMKTRLLADPHLVHSRLAEPPLSPPSEGGAGGVRPAGGDRREVS